MIVKFAGRCAKCGITIPKGTEAWYDGNTKTISHYDCPRQGADEDPAVLAHRLGYATADQFETSWASIYADWVLRGMPDAAVRETAGRLGTEA